MLVVVIGWLGSHIDKGITYLGQWQDLKAPQLIQAGSLRRVGTRLADCRSTADCQSALHGNTGLKESGALLFTAAVR